jgi:type I restriction enzyme S subunit
MEKQTNTPQLRFPEFIGEWEKKKLFELSENGFSNGAFNDPKKVGRGYRIINVKDMYIDGTINIENLTRVAIDEKEFSKNRVEYGDIFFTRSSLVKEGIAHSNINLSDADDLTFDGHLIRMRPKKDFYSSVYLYYNFTTKNSRLQFIQRGKTTTMTTIGQEDIATVEISFPTLPEQTKIAEFFTAIDAKIQTLKTKKEKLQQYKKGVMQQLFSQELRFKDENGKAFADWEIKKLGEVCDVRDGTHDSPKYVDKGFPFITSKNLMKDGSIDFENVSYITKVDYDKVNQRSKVNVNDILFGMIGTIGNPVLVKLEGFAIKNVALIKEKKELLNLFLIHFLKGDAINQQFFEQNTGGTQKFLSLSIVRKLMVEIPSLPEQIKIASFVSAIDEKINHSETQIQQTQTWKKGLLQKMFV